MASYGRYPPPGVLFAALTKARAMRCIAALVYFPSARIALLCEQLGIAADNFPVYMYRRLPFYLMRNDALDRFGTPLEKRMSASEIEALLRRCGLIDVRFNASPPFWCAAGFRDRTKPCRRCFSRITPGNPGARLVTYRIPSDEDAILLSCIELRNRMLHTGYEIFFDTIAILVADGPCPCALLNTNWSQPLGA
jgi:hypothetical protein